MGAQLPLNVDILTSLILRLVSTELFQIAKRRRTRSLE